MGQADGWQLSWPGEPVDVRVHLVRAGPAIAPSTVADPFIPQRGHPMSATTPNAVGAAFDGGSDAILRPAGGRLADRPAISLRSAWGARPANQDTWVAKSMRLAVVHHTGSGESSTYAAADVPAMLRAIQAYHMDANGWNDIGYNFIVDRFGRIWEGRQGGIDTLTVGAHAYGLNTGSVGVVILGDYRAAPPSTAALDAVAQLVAWKLFRHGADPAWPATVLPRASDRYPAFTPVVLTRIVGHQDVGATACPGTIESFLPGLRLAAEARYRELVGWAVPHDQALSGRGAAALPPGEAATGDFNKDGRDDVFWYRRGSATDELWLSNGAFGFTSVAHNVVDGSPSEAAATRMTRLDWDGDGAADLLFSTPGSVSVTVLVGSTLGRLSPLTLAATVPRATPTPVLGTAQPLVGDFDGDGDDEVAFYDSTKSSFPVLTYQPGGPAATTLLSLSGGPYRPVTGDFDGDARDDVLWYGPGTVPDQLWSGRGSASFAVKALTMGGDHRPMVADLDGDQRDDVLWARADGGTSGSTPVWAANPTAGPTSATPGFVGSSMELGISRWLSFADVDGGGTEDPVTVTDSGLASVWVGSGAHRRLARSSPVSPGSTALAVDLDGDGRDELWWTVPGASSGLWRVG